MLFRHIRIFLYSLNMQQSCVISAYINNVYSLWKTMSRRTKRCYTANTIVSHKKCMDKHLWPLNIWSSLSQENTPKKKSHNCTFSIKSQVYLKGAWEKWIVCPQHYEQKEQTSIKIARWWHIPEQDQWYSKLHLSA